MCSHVKTVACIHSVRCVALIMFELWLVCLSRVFLLFLSTFFQDKNEKPHVPKIYVYRGAVRINYIRLVF